MYTREAQVVAYYMCLLQTQAEQDLSPFKCSLVDNGKLQTFCQMYSRSNLIYRYIFLRFQVRKRAKIPTLSSYINIIWKRFVSVLSSVTTRFYDPLLDRHVKMINVK